ncbi:MAG: hypothetical protein A4E65_02632 [Syntrophorhabdus sp. PtaU1.Bin153]|nr:MAG: hypothetical protein A4E65_02632 [Syntrophorhabdus sp. PtaU1.Bin153]
MDKLAIFLNGSNMSISPCGTFRFALTVVSCRAITGTHVVPSTGKAGRASPSRPRTGYVTMERFMPGLTSSLHQQTCRSLPHPQAGTRPENGLSMPMERFIPGLTSSHPLPWVPDQHKLSEPPAPAAGTRPENGLDRACKPMSHLRETVPVRLAILY